MSSFNDFPLQHSTRTVLANMSITEPTPIQSQAIPALLEGRDVVGQAPTGSGKTLAYGIPLVERLAKERVAQALILVPTRELAVQVNEVLTVLANSRRLTTALLVGGRSYKPQFSALRYGSQIIIGTPGRVKDHLDQGSLSLTRLRICVLDEADQMLDSGFAPDIEEILETTQETRQMALFSATMPDWVEKLKAKFLKEPVNVTIAQPTREESTIEQIAYQVPQVKKLVALGTLLNSAEGESTLVFGKTKFGVEKLGKQLTDLGFTVGTLHGNKSQRAREEVLTAFRRGQIQTLLATNVAARGLDIKGIYQVINYELPESSELFTHRIGRTGRMGRQGKAITLLTPSEVGKWRRMSRSLGQEVVFQQLTLNESVMAPRPAAASKVEEAIEVQERKPVREMRTAREQRQPVRGEEQRTERRARPARESNVPFNGERRRQERVFNDKPVRKAPRWTEDFFFPEPEHNDRQRGGGRAFGQQPRAGRTARSHSASAFPGLEPRQRSDRGRDRGAAPVNGSRRASGSKRFASR